MDEVVKKTRGESPGRSKSIDEVLKEEEVATIDEAKRVKLEEITSGRRVRIAENEAKSERLRNIHTGGGGTVTVGEAPIKALLQGFVESGVEPEKAASFIKALDDESIARLVMLGGSNTNSLMPLVMMAKKESITVKDLADYTSSYIDTVMKLKGDNQAFSFKDVIEGMVAIQGMQGDNSELMNEIRELKGQVQENTKAYYETQIQHTKELSTLREDATRKDLADVRQALTNLQNRSFKAQIQEYREGLEAAGLKVIQPTGGDEKGFNIEKLTETIIKAPAVEGLISNIGESIKIRASQQRASQPPSGKQTRASTQRYCDACMAKGVRTILSIPPEVFEGKATVTCEICGNTYGKIQ